MESTPKGQDEVGGQRGKWRRGDSAEKEAEGCSVSFSTLASALPAGSSTRLERMMVLHSDCYHPHGHGNPAMDEWYSLRTRLREKTRGERHLTNTGRHTVSPTLFPLCRRTLVSCCDVTKSCHHASSSVTGWGSKAETDKDLVERQTVSVIQSIISYKLLWNFGSYESDELKCGPMVFFFSCISFLKSSDICDIWLANKPQH